MNGIVKAHNRLRTRFAIDTELGFTVVDLLDGELSVGDQVSGTLDEHGDANLRNLTTGDVVEVRIENYYATGQSAAQLLTQ